MTGFRVMPCFLVRFSSMCRVARNSLAYGGWGSILRPIYNYIINIIQLSLSGGSTQVIPVLSQPSRTNPPASWFLVK